MAQIIRYSDTPVGSYDELAILPGYFNGVGAAGTQRKDLRITGIWVSQEATLVNGRRNWNIPKCVSYGFAVALIELSADDSPKASSPL